HVKCILTSQNGGNIKAIAFRVGDNQIGHAMINAKKDFFDVVGVLRHDKWNGRNDVQFIIDDIRKVDNA
ncbi:MAG: single-stranded-DNA-specific exonuclease RecJ, partial [Alphaproteobacteria bacterium]|nr:single-stranded-DNA-specific exonuclease RecJ [Alphaproteobacteria bacterium]